MNYLKLADRSPFLLNKTVMTVGTGPAYDICVPGRKDMPLFSLIRTETGTQLVPGAEKVRVNHKPVSSAILLQPCDRIEVGDIVAVFLDGFVTKDSLVATGPLEAALEATYAAVSTGGFSQFLQALARYAGAEQAYLLTERQHNAEWQVVATCSERGEMESTRRRDLISNTILSSAIEKRKPIHVESIVGHSWEQQASIIDAQMYSIACLPLVLGAEVFGAVYLYTRTPGRAIDKDRLGALMALASQASYALSQLRRQQSDSPGLKALPSAGNIVLDQSDSESLMVRVLERAKKLSPSDLAILVRGETGTGKELLAKFVHETSARAKGPFVAVNCAAIPPALMESTLFGYVKGAFTGALHNKIGKFQAASGGTIFLDEIGDLPLDMQVKLLRALQEKEIEPVGADRSTAVDFRVIAATHQDLEQLVKEGKFRSDLYFRLNGATVSLPPLRDRQRDIPILARHFLQRMGAGLSFSDSGLEKLLRHRWEGNVRELEQVVSRAAALAEAAVIGPDEIELGALAESQAVSSGSAMDLSQFGLESLKDAQVEFTKRFVKKALEKYHGNRAQTAATLGISERTLYRLLSDGVGSST